jgi:hypothetical protein
VIVVEHSGVIVLGLETVCGAISEEAYSCGLLFFGAVEVGIVCFGVRNPDLADSGVVVLELVVVEVKSILKGASSNEQGSESLLNWANPEEQGSESLLSEASPKEQGSGESIAGPFWPPWGEPTRSRIK